mmetsp:Transcript_262/g.118  ORF Transcript_262/g.118 Transcript_262/m.118 type:complete len:207 (-) Transcript_262:471-1091(-)
MIIQNTQTVYFGEFKIEYGEIAAYLDNLQQIYKAIDKSYNNAAKTYSFECRGCIDNCCLFFFYHHTLIEYLYLFKGLYAIDKNKCKEIKDRAKNVYRKTHDAIQKGQPVRIMCPLNFDSLCMLYEFRPMICRLHGIPHEFVMPDKKIAKGDGCTEFYRQCKDKNYIHFDRTRFYVEMASLEKQLRLRTEIRQKIKMTVAEMILLAI